jgi:hypothetical protein
MKKGENGKMTGDGNVDKLKIWLKGVAEIPMHGGKPNKTEIARLAGLKDRQPFKNNPECAKLLADAIEAKGLGTPNRQNEADALLERKLRASETLADKGIAEIFELRRQLRKFQHIERIIEGGGRPIL